MLTRTVIFFQCIDDHLQVFLIAEKICIAGIDEESFDFVLLDVLGIGLLNTKKIFILYMLFVRSVASFDIRL